MGNDLMHLSDIGLSYKRIHSKPAPPCGLSVSDRAYQASIRKAGLISIFSLDGNGRKKQNPHSFGNGQAKDSGGARTASSGMGFNLSRIGYQYGIDTVSIGLSCKRQGILGVRK